MLFDLGLFDCDGVLIGSELLASRADVTCFAQDGIVISLDDALERYAGISVAEMLADVETRYRRPVTQIADFERRHQQIVASLFEAELKAIPGTEAALGSLPCKVCVPSSGTPDRIRHALSLVALFARPRPPI